MYGPPAVLIIAYQTDKRWIGIHRLIQEQSLNGSSAITQTVTYTYSPITNQRLSRTVKNGGGTVLLAEQYVYDPQGNLLIVLDGAGNVKERDLTGPGLSQILATETGIVGSAAGTVSYALTNQVGSVTDVLDASGTVINHTRYDSFGNVEAQTGSGKAMRFGYAGMQTDAESTIQVAAAMYAVRWQLKQPPR